MEMIHVDTDIQLRDAFSQFEIDTERDIELTFSADAGEYEVFVRIKNCGKLRIRTFAYADAQVKYLFWNDNEHMIEIDETHEVLRNANVEVAHCEVNPYPVKRNTYMALREPGAYGHLVSSSLVASDKNYKQNVVNFAQRTLANIDNFAVVLNGGKLYIDAIGKIVKGASRSESHQKSRVMCFDDGQSATVIPELLIDENDVQASHALTIGRIDREQLYYLQSRGLDQRQCTSLISSGYMYPITQFLSDETLQQELRAEMEAKLANL